MDVHPERGIGRALFTALNQLAAAELRPELRRISLIHLGFSGAGSLVGRMAAYAPWRFLAGVLFAPGQYDTWG